jgi:hypothetical protein
MADPIEIPQVAQVSLQKASGLPSKGAEEAVVPIPTAKRPKGRPSKDPERMSNSQFGRDAMIQSAYDEARQRGDKHSAAVQYAADFVKQRKPRTRISETSVRRILAKYRPRGSQQVIVFERIASEKGRERLRRMLEQIPTSRGETGLNLNLAWAAEPSETGTAFKLRIAERPAYPRHNRKDSKE